MRLRHWSAKWYKLGISCGDHTRTPGHQQGATPIYFCTTYPRATAPALDTKITASEKTTSHLVAEERCPYTKVPSETARPYTVEERMGQPGGRNHIAIFVEKDQLDGSGVMYHVTGTILMGMKYETRESHSFRNSHTTIPDSEVLVGNVLEADLRRFEAICESVPPPGAQVDLRSRPLNPSVPIRRCTEWVNVVVERVKADGLVR
jgi:hypothetical protein